jgi:hypothetical protein
MNYQKIHDRIINLAKIRVISIMAEKHHIIPKCMGGTNDVNNIVKLTPKEHFIIHKLLCEIYPDNIKLHYALWRMMNPQTKNHKRSYNISANEYNRRREIHQEEIRKLGLSNKGRITSIETKQKLQEVRKLQIITNETKQKISNSLIGKLKSPMTDEIKQKISNSLIGKNKGNPKPIRTEAHRKNLSISLKNRPVISCPHCTCSSISKSNMIRYHFENCKNAIKLNK